MSERFQQIRLDDRTLIWVGVSELPPSPGAAGGGAAEEWEEVGAWDAVVARVEGLDDVVTGVARWVRDAAARAAPDEWQVTFGVTVAARPGKAVALLADGSLGANLSVTLTWKRESQPSVASE
ncbi:CU044_2847 family protein [Streptacidiphilus sp. P02-A3a]|uniref:CU044_2847 family protein n=1 Tax=Streptacidiphilus sp. P02-A3a TaxID=2704468 RepID=UPI0015FB9F31|nr:CU044_2847 family protein [Streptacidiphilus sp. P02-A3a]QMU71786.1 hypothetical protein GXP74_29650 [Streptacidiphilus sp. P02-A3a]